MTTELTTIIANVTSSAKNVYELSNQMVNKRKGNVLITRGEMRMLEVAINKTITDARMSARHDLGNKSLTYIKDSYDMVKDVDINSPLGLMLMQEIRDEALSYKEYLHDFSSLTSYGRFR